MVVTIVLVKIKSFVIAGGENTLVAVDLYACQGTVFARVPDTDVPGAVTMLTDDAEVTASIDDGIFYSQLPQALDAEFDGITFGEGTEV